MGKLYKAYKEKHEGEHKMSGMMMEADEMPMMKKKGKKKSKKRK